MKLNFQNICLFLSLSQPNLAIRVAFLLVFKQEACATSSGRMTKAQMDTWLF